MSSGDLLCFYKSVVRPVAGYSCPARHSSLTVEQSNRIESFQKRALKIIYNDFTLGDNAYAFNRICHNLQTDVNSLSAVCLSRCLNYLLPAKRDSVMISSLRTAKEYPMIRARSRRDFKKSFLPYALSNYQ